MDFDGEIISIKRRLDAIEAGKATPAVAGTETPMPAPNELGECIAAIEERLASLEQDIATMKLATPSSGGAPADVYDPKPGESEQPKG